MSSQDSRSTQTPQSYAAAWADMMVRIWRDRIALAGAISSGALLRSVSAGAPSVDGFTAVFSFRYLQYGVAVDAGSGPEFSRGGRNSLGQLELLDPAYRRLHGLDKPKRRGPAWGGGQTSGKPRKPRPWFDRSWYISRRVLGEEWARLAGLRFTALFDEIAEK